MKKLLQILVAVSAFSLANVFADTIELADGTLLEGDFVGSSNGTILETRLRVPVTVPR